MARTVAERNSDAPAKIVLFMRAPIANVLSGTRPVLLTNELVRTNLHPFWASRHLAVRPVEPGDEAERVLEGGMPSPKPPSVVVATHGHCFDGMCSAALFTRLAKKEFGEGANFTY